ncbi:MAG: hypothetical protein CMB79_07925 [Filomicrobium sp.]|nr:hypothetical protein [Filomicrobium sp.]
MLETHYGVDPLRAVTWVTSLDFTIKSVQVGLEAGIFSALYALVVGGSEMVQLAPQKVQVGSFMVNALLRRLPAVRACRWLAGAPMPGECIPN